VSLPDTERIGLEAGITAVPKDWAEARLDELGQHFDIQLEHEDVDSISGLVMARLGRPPLVGDVVDYGRLRLEVTQVSGLGAREARAWLVD